MKRKLTDGERAKLLAEFDADAIQSRMNENERDEWAKIDELESEDCDD